MPPGDADARALFRVPLTAIARHIDATPHFTTSQNYDAPREDVATRRACPGHEVALRPRAASLGQPPLRHKSIYIRHADVDEAQSARGLRRCRS